jgi:broad specificity phosphatase PhoE
MTINTVNRPDWFPVLTDDKWVAEIREEYPEDTEGMTDDEIREEYANGCKYADLWDHLGDARYDYQMLADAYLELLAEREKGQ